MSKLDKYFRTLQLTSKFYKDGWGSYQDLSKIVEYRRQWVGKRENCLKLIPKEYPVQLDKELDFKTHHIVEGSFLTPFVHHIPELFPEETKRAKFQFLIPKKWWNEKHRPVVLHFAGTGDHDFWKRRLLLAQPLLVQHNVGSIIIENPFYGCRKPKNQTRSNLNQVSHLFVLGAGLVTEASVLMNWCEKLGFGPFVLTGLSMGGHMACLASTVWPKALAIVPCLNWTTASTVFTRGVMSSGVAWKKLEEQYYSDINYKNLKLKIKELHSIENSQREPSKRHISLFDPEFNADALKNLNNYNNQNVSSEIFEFMTLLMDECTHLINYDTPYDTSLVKVIAATDDAYILRDGVNDFESIWPGSRVEYIEEGHVSAFLRKQPIFRDSIINILKELVDKHYS